jgi:threonine dehydratase
MADITAARDRIVPYVRVTPVLPLSDGVLLKLENLQVTGAFKARGAFNHVLALREQCSGGVITASSGNHGQAVAYVAQHLGIRAVVVVPDNVIDTKAEGIRRYGAELVRHGRYAGERTVYARELAAARGLHYIPSYDDPYVMAGQGTIGLEIAEQCDARVVYVPVSGGGLISGVATAMKHLRPAITVIGVEPAGARRFAASRAAGKPLALPGADTIADGLRVLEPGTLTWAATNRYVDEFVAVTDDEMLAAIRRLLFDAHILVEPSGSVGAAAALRRAMAGWAVAVISGGNIDPTLLSSLL